MNQPNDSTNPAPQAASTRAWFYAAGPHPAGPLDPKSFFEAIRTGFVHSNTSVWTAGFNNWIPAGQVPQLQKALADAALLLPEAPPMVPGPVNYPIPNYSNEATRWLLPIGRSGYAIAAGYLGLFSLIGITAPFAVLFGVLALRQFKREPHLLGRGRAWFGIVAGAFAIGAYGLAIISASIH